MDFIYVSVAKDDISIWTVRLAHNDPLTLLILTFISPVGFEPTTKRMRYVLRGQGCGLVET